MRIRLALPLLSIALPFLASGQQNPLVKDDSKGTYSGGLSNKHITLWHSHGFFFDQSTDRWKWQRARTFSNVEDIGNMPYVVKYLTPMLENAGAVVLNPRERDTQAFCYIVDNDGSSSQDSRLVRKGTWKKIKEGYNFSPTLYYNENPFKGGTALRAKTSDKESSTITYSPHIPKSRAGDYAVYVSWAKDDDNVSDARYRVYHTGGVSEFTVNQKMFGATWVYLGTFNFDDDNAAVVISNVSQEKGYVTTDAVRFGGGMGVVARRPSAPLTAENMPRNADDTAKSINEYSWKKSGLASYLEGSRYYMQAAGIPDSIYSRSKFQNDYTDDYQSRPHWANFLKKNGVPIDLSVAFHTDAGTTPNDSVVGTMVIYSTKGDKFSDGRSKMENERFSRMIQDQICSDIRRMYNPQWTQRAPKNAAYTEAAAPDFPAVLIELLSHQNLGDMIYGLDPRFRFAAARAVYKGIVKYLRDSAAIIEPLAPHRFAISKRDDKRVFLSWKPTADSLEATAVAKKYRIYLREEDNGYSPTFFETDHDTITVELPKWNTRYGFKVSAVNDGGESFPTEELSTCLFRGDEKPVLIVSAFTRMSAPAWFDTGSMAGFQWWTDEGVTDGIDMAFLGYQQNFNRNDPWVDDDNPGWGASGLEWWGRMTYGNTHNFPSIQGVSYQQMDMSYVSASRDAFEDSMDVRPYRLIDVLFGEQRYVKNFRQEPDSFTVLNTPMMTRLDSAISNKVPLLLSGAYIATDMIDRKDSIAVRFAQNKLGFTWRSNMGSKIGIVRSTDQAKRLLKGVWYFSGASIHDDYEFPQIYRVESPDAIEPAKGAVRLLRYDDYGASAATFFISGTTPVAVFGFPLETLKNKEQKASFMKQVIKALGAS